MRSTASLLSCLLAASMADAVLAQAGVFRTDAPWQVMMTGTSDPNIQLIAGVETTATPFGSLQAFRQLIGPLPLVLQGGGGNVGIGTTSPLRRLHLYEANGYCELVWEAGAVAATDRGRIWRWGTSPGGKFTVGAFDKTLSSGINILTATSSGNVGLGTASPVVPLHVQSSSIDQHLAILADSAGHGLWFAGWSWGANIDPLTAGDSIFVGRDSALKSFIFQSGNVGIGTMDPTNKLEVAGTIRAKEVIVETTGWSDYVFAPDYRLAPLAEVEAHIQANGTLPGIPSAAEVAERGISVGEMQARLLAKIEELTLRQIEQDKEIRALRSALARQNPPAD